MSEVNGDKLNSLVGKMLGDLGGAFSVPTVRIGYRLGLFDAEDPPTITVVPRDDDSPFKDIHVKVKETRTGMVALTANVNSDAGVSGSLVLNQRNFDITRFPRSFDDLLAGKAFRGGGQEMRLEASPGTQFQRYSATFREPYLLDSRFGLTQK